MSVLYRRSKATVAEVQEELASGLAPSTVRTLLAILVQKGQATARQDGTRNVYEPVVPKPEMARISLKAVLQTFYDGSLGAAVSSLLTHRDSDLTAEDLDRLSELIETARKEQP
jgi:predicted transcriptional regulator